MGLVHRLFFMYDATGRLPLLPAPLPEFAILQLEKPSFSTECELQVQNDGWAT